MNRYKWYRLELPMSLSKLVKLCRSERFDERKESGFLPLSEKGAHAFRFVWRSDLQRMAFDSDGTPVFEAISTINYCDFVFFEGTETVWARLMQPQKSSRILFNKIEKMTGFGFSADPVTFSDQLVAELLSSIGPHRLLGFKASGRLTSQRAVARIEVASKEGIDLNEILLMKDIEYGIDHSTFEVVHKRVQGQISISSAGLIRLSTNLEPLILSKIQDVLIENSKRVI